MPVINFAGIYGKKAAAGGMKPILDQLTIKENQLAADGNLSPGDYDLLISSARNLATHAGMTPSERSGLLVKISGWEKSKSTDAISHGSDITALNDNYNDDLTKNVRLFGGNPEVLMQANLAAVNAKLQQLSDSINALDAAGTDSSKQLNEYNQTLNSYLDMRQASIDVGKNTGSGKPTSNMAYFVSTNEKGEITDIKLDRAGTKTGYAPTNAIYGGLQVYGHANTDAVSGKKVFQFGNTKYSGADLSMPGPDGTFKPNTLTAEDQQSGNPNTFTTAPTSWKPVDPAAVRVQSYVPDGGWAKGSNNIYYKNLGNGQYQKYVNADPKILGIDPTNSISIPKSMEASIARQATAPTVDGAGPLSAPDLPGTPGLGGFPTSTSPTSTPNGAPIAPGVPTSESPVGPPNSVYGANSGAPVPETMTNSTTAVARTAAPTVRAPKTAAGVAASVISKVGSAFKSIFA